jgi:hypothetical protein
MALDLAGACAESRSDNGNQVFLFLLTFVFAFYILADSLIAAFVIRAKLKQD